MPTALSTPMEGKTEDYYLEIVAIDEDVNSTNPTTSDIASFYPNPIQNHLSVQLDSNITKAVYSIYAMMELASPSINFKPLQPRGLYILLISSGEKKSMHKIFKN